MHDRSSELGGGPRSERLSVLVRAHQRLIERREQRRRRGAPPDPEVERELADVADRITRVLSDPGRSAGAA